MLNITMLCDLFQDLGAQSCIICSVVFLAVVYLFLQRSKAPANIPPFPEKPYPFLGHMPMLATDPRGKVKEWARRSGNIYSIYIGNQLTVVLSGYETLKNALVKKADCFSGRPEGFFFSTKYSHSNYGVVSASGENWKEQRTVALNILRSFGMGKNTLAEKIDDEVSVFLGALGELDGRPTDIKLLTNNCVSNIICNIIVGKRYDLDDARFTELMHTIDHQFELAGNTLIAQIYPWLRFVPGDPFRAKELIKNFDFFEQHFLEQFIEPLWEKEESDIDGSDCLISEYIREMRKRESSGKQTRLDKHNLTLLIIDLFLAGSETTSTTTLWFVLLMMHYPDVLGKIQKEIDENIGHGRRPSVRDRAKLTYFNAAIMETQRRASIVPFSVQHSCTETTTLNGYTIPKGTTVMPILDSVLHDEKIWPDPLDFKPERFLDDKGSLKVIDEFVPFSLGRRACLGESLAKMELFLFLSGICQRFDIRPAEEGVVPPLESVFGLTAPPKPYQVRLVEREA